MNLRRDCGPFPCTASSTSETDMSLYSFFSALHMDIFELKFPATFLLSLWLFVSKISENGYSTHRTVGIVLVSILSNVCPNCYPTDNCTCAKVLCIYFFKGPIFSRMILSCDSFRFAADGPGYPLLFAVN